MRRLLIFLVLSLAGVVTAAAQTISAPSRPSLPTTYADCDDYAQRYRAYLDVARQAASACYREVSRTYSASELQRSEVDIGCSAGLGRRWPRACADKYRASLCGTADMYEGVKSCRAAVRRFIEGQPEPPEGGDITGLPPATGGAPPASGAPAPPGSPEPEAPGGADAARPGIDSDYYFLMEGLKGGDAEGGGLSDLTGRADAGARLGKEKSSWQLEFIRRADRDAKGVPQGKVDEMLEVLKRISKVTPKLPASKGVETEASKAAAERADKAKAEAEKPKEDKKPKPPAVSTTSCKYGNMTVPGGKAICSNEHTYLACVCRGKCRFFDSNLGCANPGVMIPYCNRPDCN